MGAYMATSDMMDVILLCAFGVIGVIMKRYGYPRPPLVLGAVLGRLLEKYLFISVAAYGTGFLTRPGVLILFPLVVLGLIYSLRARRSGGKTEES